MKSKIKGFNDTKPKRVGRIRRKFKGTNRKARVRMAIEVPLEARESEFKFKITGARGGEGGSRGTINPRDLKGQESSRGKIQNSCPGWVSSRDMQGGKNSDKDVQYERENRNRIPYQNQRFR